MRYYSSYSYYLYKDGQVIYLDFFDYWITRFKEMVENNVWAYHDGEWLIKEVEYTSEFKIVEDMTTIPKEILAYHLLVS